MAVETDNGWLLHAGDAYYYDRQIQSNPEITSGFILFQRFAHIHHAQALDQLVRLRHLVEENDRIKVFCAHDPSEYEELSDQKVF